MNRTHTYIHTLARLLFVARTLQRTDANARTDRVSPWVSWADGPSESSNSYGRNCSRANLCGRWTRQSLRTFTAPQTKLCAACEHCPTRGMDLLIFGTLTFTPPSIPPNIARATPPLFVH